jgi:hypothetical protein
VPPVRKSGELAVFRNGVAAGETVEGLKKGDLVPAGGALSMADPQPHAPCVTEVEGGAFAFLVQRARVASGAGSTFEEPEPYEQLRQRQPLLAERQIREHQRAGATGLKVSPEHWDDGVVPEGCTAGVFGSLCGAIIPAFIGLLRTHACIFGRKDYTVSDASDDPKKKEVKEVKEVQKTCTSFTFYSGKGPKKGSEGSYICIRSMCVCAQGSQFLL